VIEIGDLPVGLKQLRGILSLLIERLRLFDLFGSGGGRTCLITRLNSVSVAKHWLY